MTHEIVASAFRVSLLGAVAIGRLTIGQLRLGRTRMRTGQVDELRIARLVTGKLRVERRM